MRKKLTLLFLFLGHFYLFGQNTIGLPEITTYPKDVYHAGTQNWKIAQARNGMMYFANNEALLAFDGSNWKKYKVPNETIIRSLAIDQNRIYVGAQSEIGYFSPDSAGSLRYTTLTNKISGDEKDFADVWDIIPFNNRIFFRSNKKLFELNQGKIVIYKGIDWSFLGESNGDLIANEYSKGLLKYDQGKWVPFLQKTSLPKEARITSITSISRDSSLITTLNSGFYILHHRTITSFKTEALETIASKNVYGSILIDSGKIAVITNFAGCYIISRDGEFIQRLSKQDGLLNNNILSIFLDQNKNIWLGLDNGINLLAYSNAIKHIYPDYLEQSSGYAAMVYDHTLYMGTSNGLYYAPLNQESDISLVRSSFTLIPNSRGQVWNLSEVDGNLLMGHNLGFYHIQKNVAKLVDGTTGFWSFQPITNVLPGSIIAAGTYNGINFYNYNNGKFENPSIHTHFESARYFAIENQTAWVAHPYKGLYKVDLGNGTRPLNQVYHNQDDILSANNNYIYKAKGRILLCTQKGIFEYNAATDTFELSEYFDEAFKGVPVQYLKEDGKGNLWFISDKKLGVLDMSGAKAQLVFIPELSNKIMSNGYEFIYPYDAKNIFVAGEEGFYHLNYEEYRINKRNIPLLLTKVSALNSGDSTIHETFLTNSGGTSAGQHFPRLSHSWNSLDFTFSSPMYTRQAQVEYSYYLENFDNGWSQWSGKNEKEYTNLPAGDYIFKVRARSQAGESSAVVNYRFSVLPPWYQTIWAYLVYLLAGISLIVFYYRRQKLRFSRQQQKHEKEQNWLREVNGLQQEKHEEEQKQLLYLHQLERERDEKEIIRLQNEKLEAEIRLKNTELASATFNVLQNGETLVKVREELVKLKDSGKTAKNSGEYKKIIRLLGEDKLKKNWQEFAVHFDSVHSNFLVTLKSRYPHLTPSELRLCAYLRMNLCSKEIAQIMNITTKSVELSRYRLRKKLQMNSETNLFDFLLQFGEN